MTEETAWTPTLAAQAKRRIRTCMRLFHNAEDNWGVEMASEHMDNMNPEHTLLDWIDDGIDALQREIAALTAERDRVVNSHKVLMAEADKRLETAEAELDAAKRALAEVIELAQVSYAEAIEHAKQAIAAKFTEQKEEGLDLLGQPLHQSNGES